jgi:hypothetical protein
MVPFAASGVAHSPQKRSPGSVGLPQLGHATVSVLAQPTQNLRPGLLSVPHFEQTAVAIPPSIQPRVAQRRGAYLQIVGLRRQYAGRHPRDAEAVRRYAGPVEVTRRRNRAPRTDRRDAGRR